MSRQYWILAICALLCVSDTFAVVTSNIRNARIQNSPNDDEKVKYFDSIFNKPKRDLNANGVEHTTLPTSLFKPIVAETEKPLVLAEVPKTTADVSAGRFQQWPVDYDPNPVEYSEDRKMFNQQSQSRGHSHSHGNSQNILNRIGINNGGPSDANFSFWRFSGSSGGNAPFVEQYNGNSAYEAYQRFLSERSRMNMNTHNAGFSSNGPMITTHSNMETIPSAIFSRMSQQGMGSSDNSYYRMQSNSYSYNSEDGIPVHRSFSYDSRDGIPRSAVF